LCLVETKLRKVEEDEKVEDTDEYSEDDADRPRMVIADEQEETEGNRMAQ